ncbi:hypothetical protein Kpol_1025p45 [Vanderwaltozyma polyspora DSM 70294]|uniref:Uncharacterized protein n=1 Tax=Vanderwaltozyma polyspora (strain ATCC 22028 / DSM 70294 / BCRC 21397 / CBS 2163 / NBRC 10782 / NRRL Y-8283 / UCD 57-17) TaxID=436907 RepID=A7TKW9_VANPO|nr:uncharacterized protein Kpol_1025p45 [Vanderwaltozyma polyspora DSM 70294]EDO17124.1 hypothetical protein Kpol_1025p45 [Vanderwaltozyma polyspora DSM 70294]
MIARTFLNVYQTDITQSAYLVCKRGLEGMVNMSKDSEDVPIENEPISATEDTNDDENIEVTEVKEVKEIKDVKEVKEANEDDEVPKEQGELNDDDDDDDDNSSDDFGNFSDASIEQDEGPVDGDLINNYLDAIFPSNLYEDKSDPEIERKLVELVSDERPAVIYEQLVQLDTVLVPFIWNKSFIKSTLLHILRINDDAVDINPVMEEKPSDDSLFSRILNTINSNIQPTNTIMADQFKFKYIPPLTHRSLIEEEEKEQESNIPRLIAMDVDSLESNSAVSELQQYHDQLCNAIDLLYVKLKVLSKHENDLIRDKTTFENVVTNLTSHAQRLHRDEIANYNKKKKHRYSWIGR